MPDLRSIAGVLLALAAAAPSRAAVIDRIAVSVGNQVITSLEIDREVRLAAFLNDREPDLSPEARRKTADRLVEQRLVRRELESARYPAAALSEIQPEFERLKARYPTPAAFQQALARYGISEQDLRSYLLWQATFLRFIDIRFRRGVLITDEEVRDYFEKTVKTAAAQANPGRTPVLEDYRDRIEQTLTGKRIDQDLDRWLQAVRRRIRVEYREGAFQ